MSRRTNSYLASIIEIVSANSEESVDNMLCMLDPESHDRDELGSLSEDVLGYNMITFHDKQYLTDKLHDIMDQIDESVKNQIASNIESLVDEAYDNFSSSRDTSLNMALARALSDYGIDTKNLIGVTLF